MNPTQSNDRHFKHVTNIFKSYQRDVLFSHGHLTAPNIERVCYPRGVSQFGLGRTASAHRQLPAGGLHVRAQGQAKKPSSVVVCKSPCLHTCSAEGIFHKAARSDHVTSLLESFRGFLLLGGRRYPVHV